MFWPSGFSSAVALGSICSARRYRLLFDYATSCLDFFNHEVVIAATDLRCGTRCSLDDGDPLTNEVRSLGVGWLGCPVRVGYPDADRSASGTV